MAGIWDLLQGLAQVFGSKVPGAPMAPSAAGPPAPAQTSYAPAIETALGGIAGLLSPQPGQYGPYGHRSWTGAIGQGITGGLEGYNAAQHNLTANANAAAEAALNQQKLQQGAQQLNSQRAIAAQTGGILDPQFIKLHEEKADFANMTARAAKLAQSASDPKERAYWSNVANTLSVAPNMKSAEALLKMRGEDLQQQIKAAELQQMPLKEKELLAHIAEANASTARSGAEIGHIGLENEKTRRDLALPIPTGREAAYRTLGSDGKLHEFILNPRSGEYEDKGVAESKTPPVGHRALTYRAVAPDGHTHEFVWNPDKNQYEDKGPSTESKAAPRPKEETARDVAATIKSLTPKGYSFKSYDPATNSATFERDPAAGLTDLVGRKFAGAPDVVTRPLPSPGGMAATTASVTITPPEIKEGPAPAGARLSRIGVGASGRKVGEYVLPDGSVEHRYLP